MNEKIKEMALAVGFAHDVHGSNDGNFYGYEGEWINDEISNLALAMISECLKRCIEVGKESVDSSAYQHGVHACMLSIKQYFGVQYV